LPTATLSVKCGESAKCGDINFTGVTLLENQSPQYLQPPIFKKHQSKMSLDFSKSQSKMSLRLLQFIPPHDRSIQITGVCCQPPFDFSRASLSNRLEFSLTLWCQWLFMWSQFAPSVRF
jgi:hypothetical protein